MSFINNPWLNPDAVQTKGGIVGALMNKSSTPASTSASDMFAQVTRDQWNNYVNTFVPIENKLIQYATDPSVVSGAMSDAQQGVQQAFSSQTGQQDRKLASQGVTLSGDEQAAQKLSNGLQGSLADVQAQNTARDLTVQRQQSILGNPAPQGTGSGIGGGGT